MSVKNTLAALAVRLAAVDPTVVDPTTDQIPLVRILVNPVESLNISDFPLAMVYLAPQVQNSIYQEALNFGVDHYTVRIKLFVGDRNTGIEEISARVQPWPKAVAIALMADLTLSGAVQFIGSADPTGKFFDYNYGLQQWGDNVYFGYTFDLPVCEWFQTPMA